MVGHVYIMTSQRNGTLYIGVTSDLSRCVDEHRRGPIKGLARDYGVKRFVRYEEHFDIHDAIAREKAMKKWPRSQKIAEIEALNPNWNDLHRGMGW